MYVGKVSVAKGDSSVSAGATLDKETTNTVIIAKTKIAKVDLTGEHSQEVDSGDYQVKAGAGLSEAVN